MAGLEGSPSGSLFLDIQKIPADLRLAQLIRRSSVMLGQAAHRLLINLLCLDGQSSQFHVLDHTGAQRCHRLLLRLLHTGGTTPPRHRRIASPARLRPRRHSLWRSRSVQLGSNPSEPRQASVIISSYLVARDSQIIESAGKIQDAPKISAQAVDNPVEKIGQVDSNQGVP